jgi:hypothetical protein
MLEGLPLRSYSCKVRIKVLPADAGELDAWCRRNRSMGLWWCRFLVRVIDDSRNGCTTWDGLHQAVVY